MMEAIPIGSIVRVTHRPDVPRWVVAGFVGSPHGWPLHARLVARAAERDVSYLTSPADLVLIEAPSVEVGAKVRVDGRAGVILGEAPHDEIRIRLEPRSEPLLGGGTMRRESTEITVPTWAVILENHP